VYSTPTPPEAKNHQNEQRKGWVSEALYTSTQTVSMYVRPKMTSR